jgi:putative transposase
MNRGRAVEALRRLHFRIGNIRKDAICKATTMLARTKSVIVVEDLHVKNMMANHRLAKSIGDAAMGELVHQLEYKAAWYGSRLIVADQWYPSTKRCSNCGHVKKSMRLSERTYRCEACGMTIDRDLNAARNLEQWPGVARTLKTPVEGGVQHPVTVARPPCESGTISLEGGPRWKS